MRVVNAAILYFIAAALAFVGAGTQFVTADPEEDAALGMLLLAGTALLMLWLGIARFGARGV